MTEEGKTLTVACIVVTAVAAGIIFYSAIWPAIEENRACREV
jgi:hypothetical protein